jgi:hypothetical protein
MADRPLDELVSWTFDGRGRISGFEGVRQHNRIDWLTRLLLPGLDSEFAAPGDVLRIARVPLFGSHIVGLTNMSRRTVLAPAWPRIWLQALLVLLLPLPAVLSGGWWWLMIVSGLCAAGTLFLYAGEVAVLRQMARPETAAAKVVFWRLARKAGDPAYEPPRPPVREISDAERFGWMGAAVAGALEGVRTQKLAMVDVADGRLVACEPYQIHDADRFAAEVPPGRYPVCCALAAYEADGQAGESVGYAWVRLARTRPVRWEPAIGADGEPILFGVDSGFACFTSLASARHLVAALGTLSTDYREPLDEEVMHGPRSHACAGWDWAEVRGGGASLVAFTSGPGDGHYRVYRGIDRKGETAALLVDFEYEGPE